MGPVEGKRGMVCASQPVAVDAGISILNQGGNAADAAVAIASVLNVAEPPSTGMGGDFFCLYYDKKTQKITGLNGSGRAGSKMTLAKVTEQIDGPIPRTHVYAVNVPGACRAWEDLLQLGSKKLTFRQILEPAIQAAENGFEVRPICGKMWKEEEGLLQKNNAHDFLINGKAPEIGQIFKNPNFAQTLREIGSGSNVFYQGKIADKIIDTLSKRGSVIEKQDLQSHKSEWTEPLYMPYRNIKLVEHCPNGSGIVALMALGIIKKVEKIHNLDLSKMDRLSSEYLHILIEALRLAFVDCKWYVSDPQVVQVPVKELLSDAYLLERAKLIDLKTATIDPKRGCPENTCDTVYFTVVDEEGNACSVVNSLYHHFGSGIVVPDTGIALHSRGANFSTDPNCPNVIGPSKRPYHTIIPAMILDQEDKLKYTFGVMGGFMQPQGHLQVLFNLELFGMNPQQALDAPRICIFSGDGAVQVEDAIPQKTIQELKAMGHIIKEGLGIGPFGRGQVILVRNTEDGHSLLGGSDPRADGLAKAQ
ncbi:putative gamma-glutamyltransferase ywrD-like protein [Gorgonomyces haynaldii]|nr:putative gamma-glutamyltransferase ywrD-like protein [Gorgonomyces haynaldii]